MLIKFLMEKGRYANSDDLIKKKSERLISEVINICNALDIAPQMSEWLQRYPLLWLPRNAVILYAAREGSHRFIAVSNGFLDLLDLNAEHFVLGHLLVRKCTLDGISESEALRQRSEFDEVFLRVFVSQVDGTEAMPLPHVFPLMPDEIKGAVHLLEVIPRLFAVLHEVGHFELGHLDPPWWAFWAHRRRGMRDEGGAVAGRPARIKREEHEADAFAIGVAEPDRLLSGASIFFSLLSVMHGVRGHRSDTHPNAGERIDYLRRRFRIDGEKSAAASVSYLNELVSAGRFEFAEKKSFVAEREEMPTAPEAALPIRWINKVASAIVADVKARPAAYADIFGQAKTL